MKTLLLTCGSLVLACTFASADTWTGRLIDSTCAQQQQQAPPDQQKAASANACSPTAAHWKSMAVCSWLTISELINEL